MREHWRSFKALTFDVLDSCEQDILSSEGFAFLVRQVCRVRRTGICVLAPVCRTWSWMSRHSSGRSPLEPLGTGKCPAADEGNEMVSKIVLLMKLIISRGSIFVLEQPHGSLLPEHPRFQDFLRHHVFWKVFARETGNSNYN